MISYSYSYAAGFHAWQFANDSEGWTLICPDGSTPASHNVLYAGGSGTIWIQPVYGTSPINLNAKKQLAIALELNTTWTALGAPADKLVTAVRLQYMRTEAVVPGTMNGIFSGPVTIQSEAGLAETTLYSGYDTAPGATSGAVVTVGATPSGDGLLNINSSWNIAVPGAIQPSSSKIKFRIYYILDCTNPLYTGLQPFQIALYSGLTFGFIYQSSINAVLYHLTDTSTYTTNTRFHTTDLFIRPSQSIIKHHTVDSYLQRKWTILYHTTDLYPGLVVTPGYWSNLTGTVALVHNSSTVTGTGTKFTTETAIGDQLKFSTDGTNTTYVVSSITDDTILQLTAIYAGSTTAGVTVSHGFWANLAGTVALVQTSGAVVGTDTNFLTAVAVGDQIQFYTNPTNSTYADGTGTTYIILTIADDTHLQLSSAYAGTNNPSATVSHFKKHVSFNWQSATYVGVNPTTTLPGTVTATTGSNILIGTNQPFADRSIVTAGAPIRFSNSLFTYTIAGVISDNYATLTSIFNGTTTSGLVASLLATAVPGVITATQGSNTITSTGNAFANRAITTTNTPIIFSNDTNTYTIANIVNDNQATLTTAFTGISSNNLTAIIPYVYNPPTVTLSWTSESHIVNSVLIHYNTTILVTELLSISFVTGLRIIQNRTFNWQDVANIARLINITYDTRGLVGTDIDPIYINPTWYEYNYTKTDLSTHWRTQYSINRNIDTRWTTSCLIYVKPILISWAAATHISNIIPIYWNNHTLIIRNNPLSWSVYQLSKTTPRPEQLIDQAHTNILDTSVRRGIVTNGFNPYRFVELCGGEIIEPLINEPDPITHRSNYYYNAVTNRLYIRVVERYNNNIIVAHWKGI